jgi:katanin p60 ATPase-containing subunit A1
LKEAGLGRSYAQLIDESQLSNEFVICDNVDLETIYMEFCSYYFVKFGKKARFVKKNEQKLLQSPSPTNDVQSARQALAKKRASLRTASSTSSILIPEIGPQLETAQCLQISSLSQMNTLEPDEKSTKIMSAGIFSSKSMFEFYNSHPHDWRDMSEAIMKDVVQKNLAIKWDDIIGLDDAKMILRESVIFPMKYPQLFNRVQSWKGGCGEILWEQITLNASLSLLIF